MVPAKLLVLRNPASDTFQSVTSTERSSHPHATIDTQTRHLSNESERKRLRDAFVNRRVNLGRQFNVLVRRFRLYPDSKIIDMSCRNAD